MHASSPARSLDVHLLLEPFSWLDTCCKQPVSADTCLGSPPHAASLSTLATYLKSAAPRVIGDAAAKGTFQVFVLPTLALHSPQAADALLSASTGSSIAVGDRACPLHSGAGMLPLWHIT